jgi:hypothetical protein
MRILILVSMRASIPFSWNEGSVTSIWLNLHKPGHPLDEIAVARDGRHHRRGMVVACIAFEGNGTVVGVPSLDENELGDSHPLVRMHTNFGLGRPLTVLRWS